MKFEFSDSFYVSEADIVDMCNDVKNGYDIQTAIHCWAHGLDDPDFYSVGYIEEQLAEEIKRRVESENPA